MAGFSIFLGSQGGTLRQIINSTHSEEQREMSACMISLFVLNSMSTRLDNSKSPTWGTEAHTGLGFPT